MPATSFQAKAPLSPLRLRKEVADSNLYECQPPLFQAKAPPLLSSSPYSLWKQWWLLRTLVTASHHCSATHHPPPFCSPSELGGVAVLTPV
jgi:hypothetical protein